MGKGTNTVGNNQHRDIYKDLKIDEQEGSVRNYSLNYN